MNDKRILIVDDQPILRLLVRETLDSENVGYRFREACNGAEALEALNEFAPHLAILDVMMPGEPDGLEICRCIKANLEWRRRTRVILLTARGQKADLMAGEAAGADHYLIKPFSTMALRALVATAISELPDPTPTAPHRP